jgi:caa(3)-type oxidase subunit IV
MSDGHSDHGDFSANKVFIWLFILTAAEVAWGVMLAGQPPWILWTGLIACAIAKALLIAIYFMHLKFEGWIVKGLILPTPFLIMVMLFYVSPDIAKSQQLDNPIGSFTDRNTGEVHSSIPDVNLHDEPQGELLDEELREAPRR